MLKEEEALSTGSHCHVQDDHSMAGKPALDEDIPRSHVLGTLHRLEFSAERSAAGIGEDRVQIATEVLVGRILCTSMEPTHFPALDLRTKALPPVGPRRAIPAGEVEGNGFPAVVGPEVFGTEADDGIATCSIDTPSSGLPWLISLI